MQAFLKSGGLTRDKPQPSDQEKTKKKEGKVRIVPWIEKYRPRSVEEVAHQDEVVAVLQKCIQGADLPNLLFYGPPGTGKTSTILAAARQLFGSDLYRDRVLELNASDERGINVVRVKVKNFAQQTAAGIRPDGKPCPPFKIIILDEADSMTKDAQSALRRTMERESKTTRFCLICNYVSRIIAPITSRCAKFRFKALAADVLESRLKTIAEAEGVALSEEGASALMSASGGDMRRAVMYLQSAARLCGAEGQISQDIVRDIAGVVPDSTITSLIASCSSSSYEELDKAVKEVILSGFAASQILDQLFDQLVTSDSLSDKQKAVVMEKMAETDKSLMDGADEYLQLMALLACIMTQCCNAE